MAKEITIYQVTSDDLKEYCRGLAADVLEQATPHLEKMVERMMEQKEKANKTEYGPVSSAMEELSISKPTFYAYVADGRIEVQKVGRRTLVNMTRMRADLAAGRLAKYGRAK